MTFPRIVLFINAATFAVFGAWATADAVGLVGIVEVSAPTPTARADVRATYAGFVLGFTAFLVACLLHRAWLSAGLAASGFALTGFALARALSAVLDGPVNPTIFALAGGEACGAILSFVGWRASAQAE